jgi:hypothetical protein
MDANSAEKAYYRVKEANAKDTEKLYFWAFWKFHKEAVAKKEARKEMRPVVEDSGKRGEKVRGMSIVKGGL